jgi:hypothetical protein
MLSPSPLHHAVALERAAERAGRFPRPPRRPSPLAALRRRRVVAARRRAGPSRAAARAPGG